MTKKNDETAETPSVNTEEQDHAENEAAAETPVASEPRRDGNGALIV